MSDPDPRRRACDELAELLSTPEGLRTARLLQLTEALEPRAEPASRATRETREGEKRPLAISIWQPRRQGAGDDDGELVFTRPEPHPLGDHYARRRTLAASKPPGTTRICFFGESAAAGYLYAPHLTPAEVLERQLCAAAGDGAYEVVDLARTNETLDVMLATVERSLQLDPDLLVVFAGNNWNLLETPGVSAYVPSVRSRQRVALALRRAGLAGLAELGRRDLAGRAIGALARVAELAGRGGEPEVILVVPEVNLADWQDRQPVAWLPGDGSRQWHRHYAEAVTHLDTGSSEASPQTAKPASVAVEFENSAGTPSIRIPQTASEASPQTAKPASVAVEFENSAGTPSIRIPQTAGAAALTAADAMIELDGGSCPTSHRLRAEALASLGRLAEARRACEAEVESGDYSTQCFLGVPRAARSVADLLRRQAARHGFAVVDLPGVFAEHAARQGGSPLPGRRLFLDYCHLSAEGIEVAMTAVARAVVECRGDTRVEIVRTAIESPGPGAEPAAEGLARLGAAIHGAHRLLTTGDKPTYLARWCRRALAADPGVADAMRDLLAVRCAPCPAVLTAAQQCNLDSSHRLLLQHGWRWHHLDVELIRAICRALEDAGHQVRAEVEASLLKHHGVGPESVELSRAPYLWEPLERFYPEAMAARGMTGHATYRSPWPESSFCLIAGGESDLQLELIARLPAIENAPEARRGDVAVQLNGRVVESVPVCETWSRHRIRLPQGDLRRAINRVTLVWPTLPADGDAAIENAIRRLENGASADLHPVFGEVFSLVVTTRRADLPAPVPG